MKNNPFTHQLDIWQKNSLKEDAAIDAELKRLNETRIRLAVFQKECAVKVAKRMKRKNGMESY